MGVGLLLSHPALLNQTCDECLKWVFDEKTRQKMQHRGKPVPRGDSPPPCRACPKCTGAEPAEATPEYGRQSELSHRNLKALQHFMATKNGGLTEDEKRDAIVRRNHAILNQLFWQADRSAALAGSMLKGVL